MFSKQRLGWPVLIFLSLSPLLFWSLAIPLADRFQNSSSSLISLGQIVALVGFTMFSLNIVLSARLKLFEDYFGGLDKVYIAHHILGGLAFIFLMIHPLLLTSSYVLISVKDAFFFMFHFDLPLFLGQLSLLILMGILIITFYCKLPYQWWRAIHKCIGVAFFLGGAHAFFIPSDIAAFPLLRWYMIGIFSIGGFAYLYRTVFGRFLVHREAYTVEKVRLIAGNVTEIVLTPRGKGIAYKPGQFIFISFQDSIVGREVHPFSISSYHRGFLTITAKASGDFTTRMKSIIPGTKAVVEGAFGKFNFTNSTYKHQVWIAGGIGITPFKSMADELKQDYSVDLFYSIPSQKEGIYLSELRTYMKKSFNFRIIPWNTAQKGRLTIADIEKKIGSLTKKEIFICGPVPMIAGLTRQLKKRGVAAHYIHSEVFAIR